MSTLIIHAGNMFLDKALFVKRLTIPAIFLAHSGLEKGSTSLVLQGRGVSFLFHAGGVTVRSSDGTNRVAELEFLNADRSVQPRGEDPASTRVTRLAGDSGAVGLEIPAYNRVVYHNLRPGVDLVFSGTQDRLSARFVILAGASSLRPSLAWKGDPPAWEGIAVDRQPASRNSLVATAADDPLDIVYCGYLNLGADDKGRGIAVDALGCAYVAVTEGNSTAISGGVVAKVAADGKSLVYLTLFGTKVLIKNIAVDSSGCAYICGATEADTILPLKTGPDLTYNDDYKRDAFVAKLNPLGNGVVYCGLIGGHGDEGANAIAVAPNGNAFVAGFTDSEYGFPMIGGPVLEYDVNTLEDAWVAEVKADGSGLVCSGVMGFDFHGGWVNDIALDNSNDVYLCGSKWDGGWFAKVRGGSGQLVYFRQYVEYGCEATGIDSDALGSVYVTNRTYGQSPNRSYVYKYSAGDTVEQLYMYSFYGQGYTGLASNLAVDSLGRAWVCGTVQGSDSDAFVARLKADGSGLDYYNTIGGTGDDEAVNIVVDSNDSAYVVGATASSETTFPVTVGPSLVFNRDAGNVRDAFVARIGTSPTVPPGIMVLSPNGGESLVLGNRRQSAGWRSA